MCVFFFSYYRVLGNSTWFQTLNHLFVTEKANNTSLDPGIGPGTSCSAVGRTRGSNEVFDLSYIGRYLHVHFRLQTQTKYNALFA